MHDMNVLLKSFKSMKKPEQVTLNQGNRRNFHAKLERVKSDLECYSLNKSGGVLISLGLTSTDWRNNLCFDFTVEPLHLLHS